MAKRDNDMISAAQQTRKKPDEGLWDTVKVIIEALLIAFVVRTFLYQPFNIPSGSMYPTLKEGDYLFVSKLSYGYSKYSFNFAPSLGGHELFACCPFDFSGRVLAFGKPRRGDVAVFKLPRDEKTDYIKRVVGLPGDRIQMKDGVLFINGESVKKERIEDFVDLYGEGDGQPIAQFRETMSNGVVYTVLDERQHGDADDTEEFKVPDGNYFMMGDNRDNSLDSRFPKNFGVGFVPYENFVGRADIIFFSVRKDASIWEVWRWPFVIRWSRFFNLVG
jgi:signal peptidase I